jgi:hypothetical protein
VRGARPRTKRGDTAFGAALLLACAALALALPRPALAGNELGLVVGQVEIVGSAICVSYSAATPFTPRLEETLRNGMPATVTYEVGIWKRRPLWFDKPILAIQNERQVVYDPWTEAFRVRSGTVPTMKYSFATLDSLRQSLFTVSRLPLVSAAALDSTAAYYVSVRTTIRPVSPEDLNQVEDWLSGDGRPSGERHTGIADYLLGLTAHLSGLGDRTALAKSETFKPSLLAAPR